MFPRETITPSDSQGRLSYLNPVARRLFIIALLVMGAVIASGWFYYEKRSSRVRAEAQNALTTIARSKALDLENWMSERLGDAEVARLSFAVNTVSGQLNNPELHAVAVDRIDVFRRVYGYMAVIVTDAQGQVQVMAGIVRFLHQHCRALDAYTPKCHCFRSLVSC